MTPVDIARVAHEVNRAYCADQSGVRAILADPTTTPEQSHEGWTVVKVADGWVYGPVKDADAKTHPCLVPYSELPPEQRAKDAIFGGVVRALSTYLSETVFV